MRRSRAIHIWGRTYLMQGLIQFLDVSRHIQIGGSMKKTALRIWHLLVGHAPPSPLVPTDKNGYLLCSCGRQLRVRKVS